MSRVENPITLETMTPMEFFQQFPDTKPSMHAAHPMNTAAE